MLAREFRDVTEFFILQEKVKADRDVNEFLCRHDLSLRNLDRHANTLIKQKNLFENLDSETIRVLINRKVLAVGDLFKIDSELRRTFTENNKNLESNIQVFVEDTWMKSVLNIQNKLTSPGNHSTAKLLSVYWEKVLEKIASNYEDFSSRRNLLSHIQRHVNPTWGETLDCFASISSHLQGLSAEQSARQEKEILLSDTKSIVSEKSFQAICSLLVEGVISGLCKKEVLLRDIPLPPVHSQTWQAFFMDEEVSNFMRWKSKSSEDIAISSSISDSVDLIYDKFSSTFGRDLVIEGAFSFETLCSLESDLYYELEKMNSRFQTLQETNKIARFFKRYNVPTFPKLLAFLFKDFSERNALAILSGRDILEPLGDWNSFLQILQCEGTLTKAFLTMGELTLEESPLPEASFYQGQPPREYRQHSFYQYTYTPEPCEAWQYHNPDGHYTAYAEQTPRETTYPFYTNSHSAKTHEAWPYHHFNNHYYSQPPTQNKDTFFYSTHSRTNIKMPNIEELRSRFNRPYRV